MGRGQGLVGDEPLEGVGCVICSHRSGTGFSGNSSGGKPAANTIKLVMVYSQARPSSVWADSDHSRLLQPLGPCTVHTPSGLFCLPPLTSPSPAPAPLSALPRNGPIWSLFTWQPPLQTRPQELIRSPFLFKINTSF